MPGLVGLIANDGPLAPEDVLDRMIRAQTEGRDLDFLIYSNEKVGLFLGYTWDHDLSEPPTISWTDDEKIGVLLTGENYSSEKFRLAERYKQIGISALAELNGCFSGVVIDIQASTATLFNDRFGVDRIYYHTSPDALYFSSEAKSLLAVLPSLRAFNTLSLAEFYSVGCVMQNRSLFKDVYLLPPASAWTVQRKGKLNRGCYFDHREWEQQAPLSYTEYTDALIETFKNILPRYLTEPQKIGISVTGGLDSRMIMAWLQEDGRHLPCYTFAGPIRECMDVRIGRKLAQATGHPHHVLKIENHFFDEFPALAERTVRLSDGNMDVSGAVELHVNRMARSLAPIRLTGNYGSEILRSNVAFRPARSLPDYFTPEFRELVIEAGNTYRRELVGSRLSFIVSKQMPWHHYARRSIECSQLLTRSPFLDNDLVGLAYRCPAQYAMDTAPLWRLIERGNKTLANIPTDRALRHRPIFALT